MWTLLLFTPLTKANSDAQTTTVLLETCVPSDELMHSAIANTIAKTIGQTIADSDSF